MKIIITDKMTDKIKEMIEQLTKKKLDIVKMLTENDSVYEPNTLIRYIWELRGIVKTLRWLQE